MTLTSSARQQPAIRRMVALLCALAVVVSACGSGPRASPARTSAPAGFPVTVHNCGAALTFDAPPERVLLVGRAGIAVTLHKLGVLDRVVARAGAYPDAYYGPKAQAALAKIPSLSNNLDPKGHLQLSQEAIMSVRPDLVIGVPDGMTREGLAAVGIAVMEHPAACAQGSTDSDFGDIYAQLQMYGRIFDREQAAKQTSSQLRHRVARVKQATHVEQRSAAVLYPVVGGGSGYAYGALSMSQPQLRAAGFTNVFADVSKRVFEVSREELIARDPDVLILLYSQGRPGPVENTIVSMPGAGSITAVRHDAILVRLFNFSEYPTPLTVTGLERIAEHFGTTQ